MTAPTLDESEKVRIRHHLDFLNVTEAYTMVAGVPAAIEPQFFIEGAMVRVKVEALSLVRTLLARCDATEEQMFQNQENQAVESIGDIKINKDEFSQLRDGPLQHWRWKLAGALGIIPNPYAPGAGGGMNVRVIGG